MGDWQPVEGSPVTGRFDLDVTLTRAVSGRRRLPLVAGSGPGGQITIDLTVSDGRATVGLVTHRERVRALGVDRHVPPRCWHARNLHLVVDWRIGFVEVRDATADHVLISTVRDLPHTPVRSRRPTALACERASPRPPRLHGDRRRLTPRPAVTGRPYPLAVTEYSDVPAEVVAELRTICLGLPETYEEEAWAGLRWMVRRRTFAHVLTLEARHGPTTVMTFRSAEPELGILLATGHPFFKAGWGTNVVGIVLTVDTDWDEVAELLTESYCVLAPKKLAAQVDRPDPF